MGDQPTMRERIARVEERVNILIYLNLAIALAITSQFIVNLFR